MTKHIRTPDPIIDRLLSYRDAGELLGVTERTVWSLVDQGQLPNVRFGRSVRIDPVDLRAFIDGAKHHACSDMPKTGVNHAQ